MGKVPIIKKSINTEKIQEILRGGPLHYKIFRNKCIESGMSPSTFDARSKALIRDQVIERIDIVQIIPKIREADAADVRDCLDTLKKGNNVTLLRDRLNQFQRIARDQRVLHLPRVINDLEILSKFKPLLNDEISFEELMHIFWNIFEYESQNRSPDSRDFLLALNQTSIKQVLTKIKNDGKLPGNYSLNVIRYLSEEEVIEIVLDKVAIYSNSINESYLEQLSYAFGRKGNLFKKQSVFINKKLDDLIKSGNENLAEISSKIRIKIYSNFL